MAAGDADIQTRLLATFRVEAEEHMQAITTSLLALERGLSPPEAAAVLETTFREMHTLKGAARSVSLTAVETLCQACEALLSQLTRGPVPLSAALLRLVAEGVDHVARLLADDARAASPDLIDRLRRAAAEPAATTEPAAESPGPRADTRAIPTIASRPPGDSIRVTTTKLDAVLLQGEELLGPTLAVEERVREATALVEALGSRRTAGRRPGASAGAPRDGEPPVEVPTEREVTSPDVEVRARVLLEHLVGDQRALRLIVDGLLDEMRHLRRMPATSILEGFPRMVRDLAQEAGKEVRWDVAGGELEVDRKVLELMKDALLHLVRNAVDHGIERPAARVQAGKPRQGRVGVTVAALDGGRVEIRVEDDGAGIDLAKVREAAVRARLVTADAASQLPFGEALALIYRSGLSTSPIITDISGHGLGMTIVRERVERLEGRIDVDTRPGIGTTVRIIVPASIATFRGLLIQSARQPFLLPLEAVERVLRLAPDAIRQVEGRASIAWNGHAVALARLSRVLGLRETGPERADQAPSCVIVRAGSDRAGFVVEEIQGTREVLVKELRPPLIRVRGVAAAGVLGTGEVVLILRPADILEAIRRGTAGPVTATAQPPEGAAREPRILVVDDSITTRTMEKNLLEAAGYRVRVAVDGVEAWTLLRTETFALVVSDVDMPRMDGFELTGRIRRDPKLAELPVILVTALGSREDKERGIEVGANAYIVKSSFDQSNLLEIIGRFL